MERISYRSYIQISFKLGISANQVHSERKQIKQFIKIRGDPEGQLRQPLMTIYLKFGNLSRVICIVLMMKLKLSFRSLEGLYILFEAKKKFHQDGYLMN